MTTPQNDHPANDVGQTSGTSGSKLHDAAGSVRSAAAAAAATASDTLAGAKEKVSGAFEAAREKSSDAYGTARDKAGEAYDTARDKASQAKAATSAGIEGNPLVALAGGLALGAIVGALLPRTQREEETLGPIANRITDAAKIAAAAAIDAGKQTLDEAGVNRDSARGKVDQIVDTAVKAASSARTAAADTVRKS